jgi:putative ABC transport system substrate-binding protein
MILRSGLERLTQAGKISPGSVADSASSIAAVAVRHDAPKQRRIAELALKSRLPTIYELRQFVQDGGFMSYATNLAETYRRAADYVVRILNGARLGDLPIEQPTKFELVINMKTAKALGLTIPPSLLARADHVIE